VPACGRRCQGPYYGKRGRDKERSARRNSASKPQIGSTNRPLSGSTTDRNPSTMSALVLIVHSPIKGTTLYMAREHCSLQVPEGRAERHVIGLCTRRRRPDCERANASVAIYCLSGCIQCIALDRDLIVSTRHLPSGNGRPRLGCHRSCSTGLRPIASWAHTALPQTTSSGSPSGKTPDRLSLVNPVCPPTKRCAPSQAIVSKGHRQGRHYRARLGGPISPSVLQSEVVANR
jgi:hypothetical protein